MDSPTLKAARVLKEGDRSRRQSRVDGFANLEALDVKRNVPVTSRNTHVELTQVSLGSLPWFACLHRIDSFHPCYGFAAGCEARALPRRELGLDPGLCPCQQGHLRCVRHKKSPARWEYMWRESSPSGQRAHRTALIGTLEQYPTEESAQAALNGLRMKINETRNRQREQSIFVGDLIDHYIRTELDEQTNWRSHATCTVYREFLKRWIKPHWGRTNIRDVRTVAVERWLRQLKRQDGEDLANSTKAKIRNLMSVLFNHAIRYEWLEPGKNPITLVRQSAQRKLTPTVLEPHEIHSFLSEIDLFR